MTDYYDKNPGEFIANTVQVDMHHLYRPFLECIPENGKILDAGCGSGRDALYFLQQGYQVEAFDASSEMVSAASAFIGQAVHQYRFETISWEEEFDGVWACASVLHVPRADLTQALQKLIAALKPGGAFYLSFKYGEGEEFRNERHFTNFTEDSFRQVVEYLSSLELIEMWKTPDARVGRESELWLNILLQKTF